MTDLVTYVVALAATFVGAFAGWPTLHRRPFSNPLFYAIAVLEIMLIALLVSGSIALGSTDRDVDGALFVSYLVTIVLIPPAAVLWGVAEKSRWGTGVVVVAMLTVAVLCVRLLGIWENAYV